MMSIPSSKRLRSNAAVFLAVAAVALLLDRLTKIWALHMLADGRTVPVIPHVLSLTLLRNPGASLGLGSSMTWLISCLALAACAAMACAALITVSKAWTVALGLGFAGAFGNLIDRIVYASGVLNGKVIDFLDYGWSVGNVADVVLMFAAIAVVVLIVQGAPFLDTNSPAGAAGTDRPEDAGGIDGADRETHAR